MALVAAATLVAELGDITRFANPRQLMAYLGLVPSEHSSGGTRRQGRITKAGNGAARRMLIEAAWSYLASATSSAPSSRPSRSKELRHGDLPQARRLARSRPASLGRGLPAKTRSEKRGGAAASLAPITRKDLERRYGYFLTYLQHWGELDRSAAAAGQITPGAV